MHATNLTHLIRQAHTHHTDHTITLATTPDDHITANSHFDRPATIHLTGAATIPTTDTLTLLTWLNRLPNNTPVRIGTAQLADHAGTLLTLRAGAQAIRLLTPAA